MKVLKTISLLSLGIIFGFFASHQINILTVETTPLAQPMPAPTPLQRYSFTNLGSYTPAPTQITLLQEMFKEDSLTAYQASFITGQKLMSMQIMVPNIATPSAGFPAIVMIRGFVDPKNYQTGIGTKNAARVFADQGYVTIAPDFLGFGLSDDPPSDTIESRLEKPRQLLDLLESLDTLKLVDTRHIGIWGHSNGGQIAVSLLEITSKPYPTVLWAPVTKPFPFSILYYTDESDDQGKELRRAVSEFELNYDVFDFSVDRFTDRITAPIQLHQGSADDAVPMSWSDTFVEILEKSDKDITYYVYQGADHNLQPSWNNAIERSIDFFDENLYGR